MEYKKVRARATNMEGPFFQGGRRVKLKAYQADIAFLTGVSTDRCSSANMHNESRIGAAARIQNVCQGAHAS